MREEGLVAVVATAIYQEETYDMLHGWRHLSEGEEKRVADGAIRGEVLGGPWHLEIHPTNRCNVRCFFCCTEFYRENESLPWELLRDALRDGAGRDLRFLRLAGGGEPLIYNQIAELLDLSEELGFTLTDVTTNGVALAKHARRLVEVGTDFVLVSLNEPRADRYAKTMRTAERAFHNAVEGVQALVAARDAAPADRRPTVALQFFVWRDNHELLRDMYDFALSLGVDEIVIRTMRWVDDEFGIPESSSEDFLRRALEITEEDCRERRFRLRFSLDGSNAIGNAVYLRQRDLTPPEVWTQPDFADHTPRRHYCIVPWYSATIIASGDVYPCCVLSAKPSAWMGDLNKQSLKEVWNGERFRRFRRDFHRLMLLRGDMTYSPRFSGGIEPPCMKAYGCYFGFHTCSPKFYEQLAYRLEAETPGYRRVAAQARNTALGGAQRIKNGVRRLKS